MLQYIIKVNFKINTFVSLKYLSYTCSYIMETELRIRISKEQKLKLEKKARELNISLSAYVRMKLSDITNEM